MTNSNALRTWILGLLPAPDILQTLGSTARNLGLMGMGHFVLFKPSRL